MIKASVLTAFFAAVYAKSAIKFQEVEKEGKRQKVPASDVSVLQKNFLRPQAELVFEEETNPVCKDAIEKYFKWATQSYDSNLENDTKLLKSYQNIFARQTKYGVELVNNPLFDEWVLSDWENSWDSENSQKPDFSQDMIRIFGRPTSNIGVRPLRTLDQMDKAIYTLFWFRETYGLESANQLPELSAHPECQASTKKFAKNIIKQVLSITLINRPMNYLPLLNRIEVWMDETYGFVAAY